MSRWAFSVMTYRMQPESRADIAHTVAVVEAERQVDAMWKAHRIGLRAFPKADGWIGHRVKVSPVDNVVTFETLNR